MNRLINLLRGVVTVQVEGAFPERLLNLCAQHRVEFWGLEWQDQFCFTCRVRRSGLKGFRRLGERIGCTVEEKRGEGLPYFLERFRRRYAFWVGLALSLTAVLFVSGFVFTIEVSGNERVSDGEILGQLRRLGLRLGAYGPGLELREISQQALLMMEELSWLTVNLYGTRAEVLVREEIPPPEVLDEQGCWDIVARADGVIMDVDALQGEAQVKKGDTVMAGDVLISGTVSMKPPLYSDLPVRYYQTHARGTVRADTWRTLTAEMGLTAQVKSYTGEEKTFHTLMLFGYPIDFFRNSSISWQFYDKINKIYPVVLPGEVCLPVSWKIARVRAYEPVSAPIRSDGAQQLLEEQLLAQLKWLIGEEGQVCDIGYSAVVRDDRLRVTLRAHCREEIGREVPSETGEQGQGSP